MARENAPDNLTASIFFGQNSVDLTVPHYPSHCSNGMMPAARHTPTVCLYFARCTADADQHYYPDSPELIEHLLSDPLLATDFDELQATYASTDALDFRTEIKRRPTADFWKTRRVQYGVHLMIAKALRNAFMRRIRSVGFYSGGVISAFTYLKVFSLSEYLKNARGWSVAFHEELSRKAQHGALSQCLIRSLEGVDLDVSIEREIKRNYAEHRVFIKDRRGPHNVLLAGYADELRQVVSCLKDRVGKFLVSVSPFQTVNAAHLPILDHAHLYGFLDDVPFRPPELAIITTQGETIPAGCDDPRVLKDIFFRACVAPMNTGAAFSAIELLGARILVIGSRKSAAVLDGVVADTICSIATLSDIAPLALPAEAP